MMREVVFVNQGAVALYSWEIHCFVITMGSLNKFNDCLSVMSTRTWRLQAKSYDVFFFYPNLVDNRDLIIWIIQQICY